MNLQYQQVTAEAARGIPVRRIVAKQQGADGSFDEWRDSIRPYHSSEPFEGGGAFTKIEAFNLGPLIAFRSKIGSQTMTGMVSPRQNQEFVRLRFFRSVSAKIMVGGFRCDVLPGRIYLLDYSREYWFSYAKCESLSFTIPHSLIGYDPQIHPPVIVSDPNTPQSSILRHTVETIFDNLPEMHLPEAAILAKGLIALLRLSISGALEEEHRDNFQKVRGRSMRRFLNQNLNAPELGIDMLLARFGAARATVYRDFEGVGGVSRYIADQRLERAYQELSSNAARRGCINETADRWHFASASHFCHQFKQKFGCAPSDVAGQYLTRQSDSKGQSAHAASGDAHPYSEVNAWTDRIVGSSGEDGTSG